VKKDHYFNERLKNLTEITYTTKETFFLKNIKNIDIEINEVNPHGDSQNLKNSSDAFLDTNNYLIIKDMFGKKSYNDKIIYKINSNNFRTNHFENLKKENLNILVSGCSNAFGFGLPEKYMWSNILKENFLKNKKTKFYNISFPGSCYFIIIKNIFSFIKKYGKPNFIFIDFPDINRDVYFSETKNKFISKTISINNINTKEKDLEYFTLGYDESQNYLKSINYINALEMFCNSNNIKLFWTTWNHREDEVLKTFDFENFFPANYFINDTRLPKNTTFKETIEEDYYEFWDVASDKHHPGINWNYERAKFFLNLAFEL
jgi:hypothetical protein